jgi:hypothetical protein
MSVTSYEDMEANNSIKRSFSVYHISNTNQTISNFIQVASSGVDDSLLKVTDDFKGAHSRQGHSNKKQPQPSHQMHQNQQQLNKKFIEAESQSYDFPSHMMKMLLSNKDRRLCLLK